MNLYEPKSFISGQWVGASQGKTFDVINPATEQLISKVADLSAADCLAAVDSAEQSFQSWAGLTAKARANILRKWFVLIIEHTEQLANLITEEMGKPLVESRGEVAYGASFVEWFAEEGKRIYGEVIPSHMVDKRILTIRQPVGIVVAITPWNFPLAMITRKVSPALAAGCTVVIKPSEDTPLTALAVCQLAKAAGIPDGVLNCVTGLDSPGIGKALIGDRRVRKVTFTGSTEVGKVLYRQCAESVKKISLELGGNAPFIVFDDADLDAAVDGAMLCKFRNAGQTCVCANRIFVQSGIHDAFVNALSERVTSMKVANGFTDGAEIGPLINADGKAKVEAHVTDALQKGASLVCGGEPHPEGPLFYSPTVLTGVTANMRMANEETFGPVAPIYHFNEESEVIRLANDTQYGLAAYFYTKDLSRTFRVYEALEYGIIGINTGIISTEVAPFGGVKESGLGREGGPHGIDEFLETKYGCIGIDV
ncbi:NAD-dependent succinate-semialdehyde dehydrogenase [Litorivicinus sp.]|nr:NAD-dependent succinate-semialdehyde dehydrogenase [Litorivicinus sp.]MDC1207848.1 NAD-dependent succinate-semialdehyde dehydrogenase [Litorivicinus sp.]MDC1239672.1 NAD-dependent succinate-semialdehyde dehydrogenase [Litorivicinus sp.]